MLKAKFTQSIWRVPSDWVCRQPGQSLRDPRLLRENFQVFHDDVKLMGLELEPVDDISGVRNSTTSQAYVGATFTIKRLPGKGHQGAHKRKKNDGDIKLVLSTKSRRQARLFLECSKTALASLSTQN